MPVHEIRYRPWEGTLQPPALRFFSIPKLTLMAVFNKWIALGLFVGVIHVLAYTGYLMIFTNPLISEMLNITVPMEIISTSRIFSNFYSVQFIACLVGTVIVAPKSISPEMQHKVLPMIYARPLTKASYIGGKLAAIGVLLSALTWVPALILFILMMAIYPEGHSFWEDFWGTSLPLGLHAVVYGILLMVTLGIFALACSSVTKNHVHAGVLFLIILFGTAFITSFMQEHILAAFPDLSILHIFNSLSFLWFTETPPDTIAPWKVWTGMAVWVIGSFLFMEWKLRAVDVYRD